VTAGGAAQMQVMRELQPGTGVLRVTIGSDCRLRRHICPTYPSLLHTHTSRSTPPPFDFPVCDIVSGSVRAAHENCQQIRSASLVQNSEIHSSEHSNISDKHHQQIKELLLVFIRLCSFLAMAMECVHQIKSFSSCIAYNYLLS